VFQYTTAGSRLPRIGMHEDGARTRALLYAGCRDITGTAIAPS
jgi:hypothetical protein